MLDTDGALGGITDWGFVTMRDVAVPTAAVALARACGRYSTVRGENIGGACLRGTRGAGSGAGREENPRQGRDGGERPHGVPKTVRQTLRKPVRCAGWRFADGLFLGCEWGHHVCWVIAWLGTVSLASGL